MDSTSLTDDRAEQPHVAAIQAPSPATGSDVRGISRDGLSDMICRLVHEDGFDPADFVIAGSARLLRAGIVDHIADIDLVARGSTLARAFELAFKPEHGGLAAGEVTQDKLALLYGGKVSVSERWLGDHENTGKLFKSAETVGEWRFLTIETVAAYKRLLNRPKDRDILAVLRQSGY